MITKKCIICNNEFKVLYPSWNQRKYCSRKCYWTTLNGKNISPKTQFKKGQLCPNYKGGYRDPAGYLWIWKPKHYRAMKSGYVLNSILVAETIINRPLDSNEVVHHVNENKRDDRPENLEIMTKTEHKRFHTQKRWDTNTFR